METFGTYLRNERLERHISLRQLAKRVGISATYLSHIEIDHVPPPAPDKIERIADHLGIDMQELLRRAGRWDQRAAEAIGARPDLRDLFQLAFAMDERDVRDLVDEIEGKRSVPREVGGLL